MSRDFRYTKRIYEGVSCQLTTQSCHTSFHLHVQREYPGNTYSRDYYSMYYVQCIQYIVSFYCTMHDAYYHNTHTVDGYLYTGILVHCILYSVYRTVHTATLYTVQCMYSVQYTLYSVQCMYSVQCTLYSVQCMYSVHYTVYTILCTLQCIVYVQSTLYSVQCMYSVHYTVYTLQCAFITEYTIVLRSVYELTPCYKHI